MGVTIRRISNEKSPLSNSQFGVSHGSLRISIHISIHLLHNHTKHSNMQFTSILTVTFAALAMAAPAIEGRQGLGGVQQCETNNANQQGQCFDGCTTSQTLSPSCYTNWYAMLLLVSGLLPPLLRRPHC